MQSATGTFPQIETRNLEGRAFRLPADFEGDLNIVILAFQRWQQDIIDVWVPHLDALAARHAGVRIYELPTLSSRYRMVQRFIDGGMAAGIASKEARERTLTIYTDKRRFLAPLGVTDESTITMLLVDRQGRILWQGAGPYNSTVLTSLEVAVTSGLTP
ncbi:MAG: hypothetical protein U0822_23370 [Anaerolineae bacterium]